MGRIKHDGCTGVAHDGEVATRLGLPGIPVFAETIALATILELVRATGTRVHIARLSSAAGVAMMRAAKAEGLPVSCDVGVHHVHLSDMDLGYYDSQCHLVPPLRSQRDRDALRTGLADGTVDAICSDHTPIDEDEKLLPFGESTPGATGLELLLPLTLKWAAEAKLPLARALARITSEPARVLGIEAGELAVGRAAVVVLAASRWAAATPRYLRRSRAVPREDIEGLLQDAWVLASAKTRLVFFQHFVGLHLGTSSHCRDQAGTNPESTRNKH